MESRINKSNKSFSLLEKGLTLIELIVVITLVSLLTVSMIAGGNFLNQLKKGRDARRKTDLASLKNVMEDYYNDHGNYPTAAEMDNSDCQKALTPYIRILPCDSQKTPYTYVISSTGQEYQLYTKLEYIGDPDIAKNGCSAGCGPNTLYNYGISSPNTNLNDTL